MEMEFFSKYSILAKNVLVIFSTSFILAWSLFNTFPFLITSSMTDAQALENSLVPNKVQEGFCMLNDQAIASDHI